MNLSEDKISMTLMKMTKNILKTIRKRMGASITTALTTGDLNLSQTNL
jgi:hypothetical protein